MNAPLRLVRVLYRSIRCLGIVDATCLMHLPASSWDDANSADVAEGYRVGPVDAEELARLLDSNRAPSQIGSPQSMADGRRVVVAAFAGENVVSFVWLAKQSVAATDNYSRARHLGTSIDLPPDTAFVFNAWTDPKHRGKRLIGALLTHAVENRILDTSSLVTSIDWTNEKSIRAFQFIGMRRLGTVIRIGRGRLQLSFVPRVRRLGLRIAQEAPGVKFAV